MDGVSEVANGLMLKRGCKWARARGILSFGTSLFLTYRRVCGRIAVFPSLFTTGPARLWTDQCHVLHYNLMTAHLCMDHPYQAFCRTNVMPSWRHRYKHASDGIHTQFIGKFAHTPQSSVHQQTLRTGRDDFRSTDHFFKLSSQEEVRSE